MAVKDCNELSNIIAVGIASGDEELAEKISQLSVKKRDALVRAGNLPEGEEATDALTGRTAHELELKAASADIELRAIVQAKILNGDINVGEAYLELANQIKKTGGTIAGGVELLEKVRNAKPADFNEIARLWGGTYKDGTEAISEIEDAISNFVSSNYSISEYSRFTNDKATQLRKKLLSKNITKDEFNKEMDKLHKEAMEQISKGENPSGFVKLDKEWKTIKKVFGKDTEKAGKAWTQFIMARELLTDGGLNDDMLKIFKSSDAANLVGDLTPDQIAKYGDGDLDKLLARAYTNTEQLYRDGNLRLMYREKLIELTSGKKISKENIEKVNSIAKTLQFTEQGASFSDVLVRDKLYRSAKKRGLDVANTDGTRLYNGLMDFSKKMEIDPSAIGDTITIAGVEMKPIDAVQLIYDVTGDENIIQLIRIGSFDDKTILDIATRNLLGENKVASEKILKLLSKAKETASIQNPRDLALKTITGENIKEGAAIGFFDYKRGLYEKDDLNRIRADFMDKLAEKNKMRVNTDGIKDLTSDVTNEDELAKILKEQIGGGYLVVNDIKWKDNDVLRKAVEKANEGVKEENKIIVISPHRAMDANFMWDDGKLYFRTVDDLLYKDVAGTISIQSLGEAKPTREIEATLYEAMTGHNGDKIRYQASYTKGGIDSTGAQISDQQIDFFSGSKVRDEKGNLIKVYHGTNAVFENFDLGAARRNADIQGIFFSSKLDEASGYGDNIIECYLNITNPADYDTAYGVFNKYKHLNDGGVMAREELERMGFDGVDVGDGEYIVFSQSQIKAADNKVPTIDSGLKYQRSYHGTQRPFTKFDLKYGGEANGSIYGFGVYLTKEGDVAAGYAEKGYRPGKNLIYRGSPLNRWHFSTKQQAVIDFIDDKVARGGTVEDALETLKGRLSGDKDVGEFVDWLSPSMFDVEDGGRHIYTVDHPDNIGTNYIERGDDFGKERFEDVKTKLNDYIDNVFGRENVRKDRLDIPAWNMENPKGEDVYHLAQSVLGTDEEATKFFDSIGFDGTHYFHEGSENYVIFDVNKANIVDDYSWQRRFDVYRTEADMAASDAMKVKMFTKNRSWKEIADAYGISVKIVEGDMIEGVKAYGAYGNGVIYFTDMVKESTAPHELFHAMFDIVDKETYDKIIADGTKLFGMTANDLEEVLADEFSSRFRTGKFTYGGNYRKLATKKRLSKKENSMLNMIKKLFEDLKEWLGLVDEHRGEVKKLFEDMVNMKYLPDAGSTVNAAEALGKYNDELNDAAMKYFGEMLGVSGDAVDAEYVSRVKTLLSERVGIDIKAFDQIKDKSTLWRKIDKQFALDRLTAGKYDKVLVDVNGLKREIEGMSEEELARKITQDVTDVLKESAIIGNENIAHIREAYLDFMSAGSAVDSLTAKGKIISLVNGGSAQEMSIQEIKEMFKNGTFETVYKQMFFPDQEVSPKDMKKFIASINSDMFDVLSIGFAENLVNAGYALPLVNIKDLVYDFLTDKLDLNSKFVEAFFYKNNIPFTSEGLNTLVNTLMPKGFKFDYEDALFKGRFAVDEPPTEASVFRQVNNRFLQDSYSALASIQMARAGDMPINYEEEILTNILDKYVSEIYDGVKSGKLSFKEAQGIKQEASYALDMFEQDFLIPRYGRFLSQQERQGLMGMKYSLPIGVAGQNPDKVNNELRNVRNSLLQKYKRTLGNAAQNNDINLSIVKGLKSDDEYIQKQIDKRREQLMDGGGVIREVNGQYLVYDVKQALEQTINTLPDTIRGLEGIKNLGREGINGLSNRQAYVLLRYLEAAKGLNTTANYVTELMYKQNPMLQKYAFFEAFRVEDGLPRALKANALNTNKLLAQLDNTSILDQDIKKNIFAGIIGTFRKKGHIEMDDLDGLVKKAIDEQMSVFEKIKLSPKETAEVIDNMKVVYKNAFTPYTYLRDIPKGGTLLNGDTLPNMKERVREVIKQQYNQAMTDLKAAGVDDMAELQESIYIKLNDGTEVSLKQASNMDVDNRKKNIFNDEGVFVSGADEMKIYSFGEATTEAQKNDIIRQEKRYRENIINGYNATLQSMLNQTQVITDAEKNLMTAFMNDVRTTMRRYSLTNNMVDALDAVSGLNEEAARGIKDYLIGWKAQLSFGKRKPEQVMERYNLVKDAYAKYYVMDLSKINSITPTTRAEDLALKLAKYFKNLERLLGSADGLTGCTTRADINRAFYHLGEVFMNLESTKGIFGMLSAIEQNQVLKFFKFSKSGQPSHVKEFIRRGTGGFQESLGGYRDYAETISGITASEFNSIFGSAFTEEEFKRVIQGLTGFSLVGDGWGRTGMAILNFLNGSNAFFRAMMSYPGQLLTIPQQGTAYFLKQIGFERHMGIESLSDIEKVRSKYGILDGVYNEINIRGKSSVSPDDVNLGSFYNRYGIPDVDGLYQKNVFETTDDYISMYAKIDKQAASSESEMGKWFRQLDPYKDNANNIIDGLFARNFKDISFAKALKENDYMQFSSASAFMEFMEDPTISATIKTRAMDRVSTYAGRNMRNILGLGFGGLDRPVAGSGFGNIMYGIMQLFNFRGAWGQNIFKQAGSALGTMFKMLFGDTNTWSREGREAIAKYIATQPEFLNFTTAVFNDIRWTRRLQRFQDNGRRPTEEGMYDFLDFLDYFRQTMNMTSQVYQGLQSFGPFRPIDERAGSMLATALNPTIYKDTYGIGAFFNALGKNFGRQWKPYNWLAKLAGALTTDGPSGAWAYIQNKRRELSFGSLRYMTNEDENAYGYTYELIGQTGGIPSIIMGEAPLGSDKSFMYELDNSETWETITQVFDSDLPWDTKQVYLGNLWKTFVNGSQLFSLPKNIKKAINKNAPSPWTSDDLADVMQSTPAGLEFYTKGYVTPSNGVEAKEFFDIILKNSQYRPGSSSFNKSLMQFETYGHMNGKKDKGNAADAEMELWLQHMKYSTNSHGEFIMEGGEKVVDPGWTRLIQDVQTHYYNQTYVTNLIYAYSKTWLDTHSSDPNYQLYVKMLGQGHAHNLIENEEDKIIKFLNIGAGKKADTKWNETELENSQLYLNMLYNLGSKPLEGDDMTFFDRLQRLDQDNATVAALSLIKGQATGGDRKIMDRFFNITDNDDGSKSIDLKYQYKEMLTQLASISRAFDEGNVERGIAEASSLAHMFSNDDPTGAVTATMIDSIYHRVYDTNTLSPEQKQEVMIALFHDNKEFIQRNPEKLREILGDAYDLYADYMNKMLYQWDGELISNLESIQSKGSKSASSAGKAAKKLSSAFKKMANSIGGDGYTKTKHGGTNSSKQWVPVKISGANLVKDLGVKGYSPSYETIGKSINSYKPKADFSISKDINRKIKTTKTQKISNKKQLSEIEKKTTKALTAEA